MSINTMKELQLSDLKPTQTILELADRSKLKPKGIMEDVMVSLVSWEYPIDFMLIQPELMEGHPMILGRPWLTTANAYISCRKRGNDHLQRDGHKENHTSSPFSTCIN